MITRSKRKDGREKFYRVHVADGSGYGGGLKSVNKVTKLKKANFGKDINKIKPYIDAIVKIAAGSVLDKVAATTAGKHILPVLDQLSQLNADYKKRHAISQPTSYRIDGGTH